MKVVRRSRQGKAIQETAAQYSANGEAVHLNLLATPILNHDDRSIRKIASDLQGFCSTSIAFLRLTHQFLIGAIKPIYTLDEFQPASVTLRKGRGSCSQRIACLEALSRANEIPTRVRGLWIDGRFWYPRFFLSRPFIPRRILLAWPQFYVDGRWLDFDELHGSTEELAAKSPEGFSNAGETLFEAVAHTAVDFYGKTAQCGVVCSTTQFDLSRYVVGDEGLFVTRDELFAKFGALQNSWRGRIFELIFGGRKSA
jgi:Transglutaminase-like superfamily